MTLKNEELLSKYFERKMTSSEEQNFLISVAANDELRLAFRSQLELMRAVSNDKDGIRSAAEVRARTLAAIGLSTLAADSFLEHELLSRRETEGAAPVKQEVVIQSASAGSGFMSALKSPITTIVGGLAVGFMAAVAIFSNPEPEISRPVQEVVAPQTEAPATSMDAVQQVPQNVQKEQVLEEPRSFKLKPRAAAQRKAESETIAPNSGLNSEANGSQETPPVIDRTNSGGIKIGPAQISKPSDSTAKQ